MAKKELDYIPFRNPYKAGRPLHYTPEELAGKFAEFVEWAQTHPVKVEKHTRRSGTENSSSEDKTEYIPRLISVVMFLNWLGETKNWWTKLSDGVNGEEFFTLKERITQYCFEYQYARAASNQFNANIVARYLGLKDQQEVEQKVEYIMKNPNE